MDGLMVLFVVCIFCSVHMTELCTKLRKYNKANISSFQNIIPQDVPQDKLRIKC